MSQELLSLASGRPGYPAHLQAAAGPVQDWINHATADQLFRINVAELSARVQVPVSDLRDIFLYAVADGLFNLSWEFHCPHCHAIPDFHHTFQESKGHGYCPLCNVEFRNTLDRNVEVTFTVHPSIVSIPAEFVEARKMEMMTLARVGQWTLPARFLSGMDCLHSHVFREMFGDDVLSSEESLAIERAALLFTDIRGSTRMYSDLGDPVSYNVVRNHFKILFRDVQAHGGVVVKTIGDAVMASFHSPARALAASLQIFRDFRAESLDPAGYLQIRTGIHAGPVIVVTLNDRLDYFGNTVNMAARIQGKIESHSVGFSRTILDDPACREELRRFLDEEAARGDPLDVVHRRADLKGIDGKVDIYSLRERS